MLTNPPFPDPPPVAVRVHQPARIVWAYTFDAVDSLGRHVKCYVPVHRPRVCKVVKR